MVGFSACSDTGSPENILPIYGHKELDSDGDTIYHVVEDFSFTNQDGITITKRYEGRNLHSGLFFYALSDNVSGYDRTDEASANALPETILTHTCDLKMIQSAN